MEKIIPYIPGILSAIAMLAILAVCAVIWLRAAPEKRKALINHLLYSLAVEAERLYGGKTGQIKKAQVIAWFYARYKWLSWFLPEAQLGEWIDEKAAELTDYMKSNPLAAQNLLGKHLE